MEDTQPMSVSEAVASRSSCRDYLPKEVALDLVMKILDEARRAPSSGNLQPWKIYLIHGEQKKKLTNIIQTKIDHGSLVDLPLGFPMYPNMPVPMPGLMASFKRQYPKYHQRLADIGKLLYSSQGIKRGDHKARMDKGLKHAVDFFGAPLGLILTIDKGMVYGQYPDLGIFLQTIMLLCQQYGLSTCAIVGLATQHETLKKALNIASNEKVFCGLSIGYKNDKAPVNQYRTERMSLDDMVVVPKINENIKMESPYWFKAKIGMSMTQFYVEENLPFVIALLAAIAILVWFILC